MAEESKGAVGSVGMGEGLNERRRESARKESKLTTPPIFPIGFPVIEHKSCRLLKL